MMQNKIITSAEDISNHVNTFFVSVGDKLSTQIRMRNELITVIPVN